MYIPVPSPWLPGYIHVVQTVLITLTMAGLFPDGPHHNTCRSQGCGEDQGSTCMSKEQRATKSHTSSPPEHGCVFSARSVPHQAHSVRVTQCRFPGAEDHWMPRLGSLRNAHAQHTPCCLSWFSFRGFLSCLGTPHAEVGMAGLGLRAGPGRGQMTGIWVRTAAVLCRQLPLTLGKGAPPPINSPSPC
ncbi:hypothetical protein HJG60_010755 [Phyllostomus discolor]|uniref:Uncharacterized protein n=1 Tax=Phyllostomus discolor TaxID=89673 RepID=A0A834E6C1_9CHIR|nr:hypothetical protein HJG60_010755 [Phyllostomus discolor]